MQLAFLQKQKFIITIGDDGAVLTLVEKEKMVERAFANSASISDRREINVILNKYPNIPIYVLLDTIEQTYAKQSLPGVSPFTVNKLVKRRLDRDFAKTDIKGAIPIGRDTSGRKDWLYMFISTPSTPNILDWLDYIATLPNRFAGIYMLPIEMQNFMKAVNKAFFKGDAERKNWQFIVSHNKTGGFRQTILNNDKVVFTRLIRPGKDTLPDIVAGNIEQEIINTIDYLRRLGLSEDDGMNIFVIVSKELKNSLSSTKIRGKQLLTFTPFEIAKLINLEHSLSKDDKFADILISNSFANNTGILRLENPRAKALNTLLLAYKFSSMGMFVIIPLLILYSLFLVYEIISYNNQINEVEDQKARTEKEWKNIKNTGEYNIDEATKIADAITLRKKILEERKTPIEIVENLAKANINFIMLQSITWNYDKDYNTEGKKAVTSSIFNLDFSLENRNLDAMFRNYDILSTELNSKFNTYNLDISKLPDKINLDEKIDTLPIQVKLSPKDPANQQPGAPSPQPNPGGGF